MKTPDIEALRKRILNYYALTAKQAFIDAGGVRTFYLCSGAGAPVVLLHGAGGGGVLWGPVIRQFSEQFKTFVPDVVGYGETEKPDGAYDREFYADWLRRFLDAVGVDRASLVGNSQGGAIALKFALDHPDRVDKLVLACSAGLRISGVSVRALFEMLRANLFLSRRSVRRLTRFLVHDTDDFPMDDAVDYMLAVAESEGGRRPMKNGKGKAVRPFEKDQLERIRRPALVIWGTEDRLMEYGMTRRAPNDLPNARVEFMTDAGHTPFIDKPYGFCNRVMSFLAEKEEDERLAG